MRYCLLILSILLLLGCVGCHNQTGIQQAPPVEPSVISQYEGEGATEPPNQPETVFTVLDEPSLRNYYAQLGKELLYCQIRPEGDFAVVAFEYAPNDFLWLERIDRMGKRDHFLNAYWVDRLKFSSADSFYLIGYFSVNGMAPPRSTFPQKESYYRNGDNGWCNNDYRDYRAPLPATYTIGNGTRAVLTGLRLTAGGLDLEFGPQEGHEGDFYAGYASIPVSEFRFDAKHHSGLITMQDTILGVAEGEIMYDDPDGAIHGLRVYGSDGYSVIELELNEQASYYSLGRQEKLNYDPIATLRFYCED